MISRGGAGGYSLVNPPRKKRDRDFLVYQVDLKNLFQVGITSWGDGCAVPGTFGVYSRVTELMDWIAQQYGFTGVG